MVGLGAVLGVLAVVFLVTRVDRLTDADEVEVEVGDTRFTVGPAASFADLVEEQGPLLLPDAARGQRDLWLHHRGDSDREGWVAFAVRPPGAPRDCFVDWDGDDRAFVDNCAGTIYPESGEGLDQYHVSVSTEGDLVIDLKAAG